MKFTMLANILLLTFLKIRTLDKATNYCFFISSKFYVLLNNITILSFSIILYYSNVVVYTQYNVYHYCISYIIIIVILLLLFTVAYTHQSIIN